MKAVVMAGGEGSRLRPLTSQTPKPLVPVAGTPIVEHILRLLRVHSITEVILTVAYLGVDIRNRLGDGSDLGMHIEYVSEESPLGTAGSVKNAEDLIDDTFLVISGDALTDIDLTWAIAEHRNRGVDATIVLYSVPNPLEYGVVVTEPDGQVQRFLEKPSWGEVFSDQANTGIYVLERRVLDYMRPDTPTDWSQDVFPQMLRKSAPLHGIVARDAYWCDVGNTQSYRQANWDALDGRVRCHIPGSRQGNVWMGEGVKVGPGVRIDGPAFIGDEVRLKKGAHINDYAVIDRHTTIDENSKVSNAILWPHSYVGEGCRLRQSVICGRVTIKDRSFLEDDVVVGDDCVIGRGSRIRAGVKIWPHKDIEPGSTVNESVVWTGEWRHALFSSHGMDGLVNVELTPEFSARVGAAFAATLPKGSRIAVGRDHSRASRMIKRAMVSGIVSAGAGVYDLSGLPVPLTQYTTRTEGCDAGVHVHISPRDQRSADIRFFDGYGLQIDKRGERRFENLFFREDFRRSAVHEMGNIEYGSPIEGYRELVLGGVDVDAIRAAELRVLIDYAYSTASLVLPDILNELGVVVVPLNAGTSGGPAHRTAPGETALIAHTVRADVGCRLNPTGERITLIDDEGTVLAPHEAFGVLTDWWLPDHPGVVVAPATAPYWMTALAEAQGSTLGSTKCDPASVLRASAQPGVSLAADLEGGFIWPDRHCAFDAMYTLARILERRALSGELLSHARARIPDSAQLSVEEACPWEMKGRIMRILVEQHRDLPLDLVDGIKVHVDGGFVLVRPDPDLPSVHIAVSVEDGVRGHELMEDYVNRIRGILDVRGPVPTAAPG
ncbi:MAG: sugar phosphate nucleotidyltransferase [Candidatus Dormibacteria bacterium]